MSAWLDGLKTGDEVVVVGGLLPLSLQTVERTTATQILVGGRRFRRRDGYIPGNGYYRTSLSEPTPDLRKAVERKRLLGVIGRVSWESLQTDQLRQVWGIVK